MRIAHISDPHVNLKFHPQHLPRLRRVLEDALKNENADHIVITGDITSNADARDLRTTRRLFESLGLLSTSKLTIIPGNHDLFGGPHLAEEVISFPERCKSTDLDEKLAIFQDHFAELFTTTITADGPYPFLKRLRNVCFMGLNSIAEYSLIENPVGSNGEITRRDQSLIHDLSEHHAWHGAAHRIVLMHHHMFRRRDVSHLHVADGMTAGSIGALLEARTLKLHRKRQLVRLFDEIGANLVLHGHVHFTGDYQRQGLTYVNSAGAVFPASGKANGYNYHIIDTKPYGRDIKAVRLEPNAAGSRTNAITPQRQTKTSSVANTMATLAR